METLLTIIETIRRQQQQQQQRDLLDVLVTALESQNHLTKAPSLLPNP